jgi:hypothetical protein
MDQAGKLCRRGHFRAGRERQQAGWRDRERGERREGVEEDVILVCGKNHSRWYIYGICADKVRPKEFVKKPAYEDSDEEESTVGKMPPSESDEE